MSVKKIVYVGLDVDDTAFHGMGLVLETGECFEFKCKPDHGVLRKKLNELFKDQYTIRLCYEACYIGYSLCRFLRKHGIHCDVIAPSLIPVKTGTRVKTDRLDAAKLAEYYAKGLLTPIYIPDETDEEVRDILRSRIFWFGSEKCSKPIYYQHVNVMISVSRMRLDIKRIGQTCIFPGSKKERNR